MSITVETFFCVSRSEEGSYEVNEVLLLDVTDLTSNTNDNISPTQDIAGASDDNSTDNDDTSPHGNIYGTLYVYHICNIVY